MTAARKFYQGMPNYCIALVGDKKGAMNQNKYLVKNLGFAKTFVFHSYLAAMSHKSKERFTHVLFESKEREVSMLSFVEHMIANNPGAIMIAVSEQPRIDRVFELLQRGAKGFLVPPLNLQCLEDVLIAATSGPPISESILDANDRNRAFAEVILNNLYKVALALRQAREYPEFEEYVFKFNKALLESVEMALTFCENGETDLREKIIDCCLIRADDEKTRLGKIRSSLRRQRSAESAQSATSTNN